MTEKEPFVFEYTIPSLDWYTTIRKQIEWAEYDYFEIEYRYGPSYWLIGYKQGKREEIGELRGRYIQKFIKWSEFSFGLSNSSKLAKISVISTSLNIVKMMKEIVKWTECE